MYLENQEIRELAEIGSEYNFGRDPIRDSIFLNAGINQSFYRRLTRFDDEIEQIRADLRAMVRVHFLELDDDYEVPLALWLQEANDRLKSQADPVQRKVFREALRKVAHLSETEIANYSGAPSLNVAVTADGGEEKIVLRNDMLSFGWLAGASTVGQSIARLTVTRYENGSVVKVGGVHDKQYYGTGWLLGPQHIMTNHHVINARAYNEANASDTDLRLQAENTAVEFDYDDDDVKSLSVAVESLRAWSVRGDSPALDYAILKLAEPVNRRPLTLAPDAIMSIGTDPVPLNIIQHPGGGPKMLGVRNNLAHRLDEYELSYFTDTEGGSSGSPVCDDSWRVVALHKKWQRFVSENIMFQGQSAAWENRGTRINRIIADMKNHHLPVWNEVGATVV